MTAPVPTPDGPVSHRRPVSLVLLAAFGGAMAGFATGADVPWFVGLFLVVAGVGGAAALRTTSGRFGGTVAVVPALGSLVVLSVFAPSTPETDLFGGVAAIALLAWLAEDPRRVPGGFARGGAALLLVLLTFGIAWASAFLLPPGTSLVGIGAALLVLVTILVAVLLGRPDLIDREPPATA
ncbi:MAG: hypothetical protein ACLQD8_06905 [Thermoplasmata archaeon]